MPPGAAKENPMSRSLPGWATQAPVRPSRRFARLLAAALLHSASRVLARAAERLSAPRRPHVPPQMLEFHADAGAPEGALYADGELVALLPGVTRL
jgi:hypothetical protein